MILPNPNLSAPTSDAFLAHTSSKAPTSSYHKEVLLSYMKHVVGTISVRIELLISNKKKLTTICSIKKN